MAGDTLLTGANGSVVAFLSGTIATIAILKLVLKV